MSAVNKSNTSKKRRSFERLLGNKRYRKKYVVATEGKKTEPAYFNLFNNLNKTIFVKILKSSYRSDPAEVLKRIGNYLKKEELLKTDEAWIIIDKDQWTDKQIAALYAWSQTASNYGLAISNPLFEYWLLLHFEEGHNIKTAAECKKKLNTHLPNYNNNINARKITLYTITQAIDRAKKRNNPPCADWPRDVGTTTVYELVENLLHHEKS